MSSNGKKITLKAEYIPVLKKLRKIDRSIEAKQLSKIMDIPYEKLMSGAVYNLQEAGLTQFTENEQVLFTLTEEAKEYVENGLPSRQMFQIFTKNDRKEALLQDFQKEVSDSLGFSKKMFFIGISNMKKNKWIVSSKATGQEKIFAYTDSPDELPEEKVLDIFRKKDRSSLTLSEFPQKLQSSVKQLRKRKLLQRDRHTVREVKLTDKGKAINLDQIEVIEEEVQLIDSQMLSSGTWKSKLNSLKKYDVELAGPRINTGKYHPITILKNEMREIFHSMGFHEIRGPLVETAFHNFDCLYQPQDHPARELHDTFYLKNPATGKLPNKKLVKTVKAIHENGGDTGSTGWRYEWSEKIAKQTLMRTHSTATTVRNLARYVNNGGQLPIKVFCVDRVFRNEKVDRTHLAEFEQIEGIIIDKDATLADLIGQITEFYKKMGFSKVITRPGFFPYTEPSMEVSVYSENLESWLEMGGSGIFRPEVSEAWGIKNPVRVLAWGLGMERLAMLKLKRKDIRDLYQSPIEWLREVSY